MDNINEQFHNHLSGHPTGHKHPLKMAVMGIFAILLIITAVYMIFATQNEAKRGKYIGQDIQVKNTITVSGEGKVLAKPDIGEVSLTVLSESATVAAAQKDNTQKMNNVIKAMKDLGVDEKDLKTVSYNISPNYQYTAGRSIIIGYQVSQTLDVKIRQLDKASDILAKAAANGVNQIGSLSFTIDDPESIKAEARKKAIDDAKQKAEVLKNDLGVSIVRIVSFSESGSQPPITYLKDSALGMGGGGATPSPEVQTGQNEITVDVSITYEIQ
ncbi:MAG: SIMPL domain-containing protein [bacterium]